MTTLWSSQNGDVSIAAINNDGSITLSVENSNATATGIAILTAADVAALQQVVAPGSTILSVAATTAIAALVPASATAEEIVNALQGA